MAKIELFENYEKVIYNGVLSVNLMNRISIVRDIVRKYNVFYPYIIKEGERADSIAYDYYGSSRYTWLIYVVNEIYDPYYQWPLTSQQLIDYLNVKYGDYIQTQTEIMYYEYNGVGGNLDKEIKDYKMTPMTYSMISNDERVGWEPVTIFEYENKLNESKREILLISNRYSDQVVKEVMELFKT